MIIIILLLVAVAGGGLYWWTREPVVQVRTVEAAVRTGAAGAPNAVLNASGYVTARRRATVSSKVTGKVMEIFVEEGQAVKRGQVLARLDDSQLRAMQSGRRARDDDRLRLLPRVERRENTTHSDERDFAGGVLVQFGDH